MTTATEKAVDKVGYGKGLLWKPVSDRIEFTATDKMQYQFIDYFPKKNLVRLWQIDRNDKNSLEMRVYPYSYFSIDDLKAMGVWDILRDEQKKTVEMSLVQAAQNASDTMEHARRHRTPNSEYVGIPRKFVCKDCGNIRNLPPALVISRSKSKGITVEEFEKSWICSKCKPVKKGRVANPKYAKYPRVMKCNHPNCKVEYPQQPCMTDKLMTDKGLTLEAYCSSWLCKEHRPKKVHHFTKERLEREAKGMGKVKVDKVKKEGKGKRRGRAANPAFEGIAKELTCNHEGCKVKQAQHPSISIKAAEGKGITLDEYFSTWKCREHREKKIHHMSKEGRALRKQEVIVKKKK
jgi:hypothetical protein